MSRSSAQFLRADNYNGIIAHLNRRDVGFVAISRAPWDRFEPFKRRMGWSFKWVSSHANDFNYDYHVSFTPEQQAKGEAYYNYAMHKNTLAERSGMSVFYRDAEGAVFHTYSCYAPGLDMMNTAYHHLDLVPKGRDEPELPWPMAWVRYRDEYRT